MTTQCCWSARLTRPAAVAFLTESWDCVAVGFYQLWCLLNGGEDVESRLLVESDWRFELCCWWVAQACGVLA